MKRLRDQGDSNSASIINSIKSTVNLLIIIEFVYAFILIGHVLAIASMTLPTPVYASHVFYEIIFVALGILVLRIMAHTTSHNRRVSAYNVHCVLWFYWALLLALAIAVIIEMVFVCPNTTPIYCTDGSTSQLTLSYIFFAIFIFVEVVVILLQMCCFRPLKKANDELGYEADPEMWEELVMRQGKDVTSFVPGIGSYYVTKRQ